MSNTVTALLTNCESTRLVNLRWTERDDKNKELNQLNI